MIVSPPGSGKSVIIGKIASLAVKKGGYVLFLVHRKELKEQIMETFSKFDIPKKSRTIETVMKVKNHLGDYPQPTLIITDETHHARAKTYQIIYEYYAGVPKLGFTATPWRLSGDGFADTYDAMVEGPSVQWLIDNRFLAPYKYFAAAQIDRSKLKKNSTGDYTNKSMDLAIGGAIYGDTVKVYQQQANDRQAIVYAHSVDASQQVAKAFSSAGISAVHADAKTPKKEREQIMADFKSGKIKVLSNVDLISEGFDVPDCGVVILLRPTKSLVMFLQQAMRGMRYRPHKQAIIIDQVANFEDHGLPSDIREWSLDGKHRQPHVEAATTCVYCYAVFYKGQAEKTADGRIICPACGEAQPKEERGETEEKDIETDVEFIDLQSKRGKLLLLAAKKPTAQRTMKSIYEVLDAQAKTGVGSTKYPVQRTLHIMLDKHPKGIDDEDLMLLAHLSRTPMSKVDKSYEHALATHKTPQQRKQEWLSKQQLIFNF